MNANGLYVQFISRDLTRVIESIVPEGKQGLPNLVSTKQVRIYLLLFWSKSLFSMASG